MPRRLSMAVAGLALLIAALPAHADTDIRSLPISMHEKDIRSQWAQAEPSIALDSKDHVFICGPVGVPGGQMTYVRSTDWTNFS
ncbi:MAG: hypothetical protein ABR552_09600, partial [Actinomycetota bacterium]